METQTLSQQNTSAATGTYHLVKGEFTHEEASEILNDLFSKKINFNRQKRFSQQIRFGEHDARIDQRINDLEHAYANAQKLVSEAAETGRRIRLNSEILIELI